MKSFTTKETLQADFADDGFILNQTIGTSMQISTYTNSFIRKMLCIVPTFIYLNT